MSVKKDFILPVTVLSLICLVISGALAVVNNLTKPVIENAASQRAAAARQDIIPAAEGFELIEAEGLPKRITEVYRTTNNVGYIFMITTHGYAPEDIKMICGIDPEGKVIKTATLSQNETQGLGTPIFEQPHAGQYWGRDRSGIEGVAAISGATITSNAYKNGIRDAFAAFEIVKTLRAGGGK
ncbi:MAG: FMN-binding protein [Treponema sp.]|jgi:electron transport complex protein RnfG|nr:FMN-binding protein [Treponema sp.]